MGTDLLKQTENGSFSDSKSNSEIQDVIKDISRLFRRYHLTYEQTQYVFKQARQALGLQKTRRQTSVVQHLSQEELEAIINTAYKDKGSKGLIIKTLFLTGARVSEFVNMMPEDVYFDENKVLIRQGKGSKQRFVPILPSLAQELKTHLNGRKAGYLFENNRSKQYSSRSIQQMVKEMAKKAGIYKRVYPHLLRHTIATMLVNKGMNIEQVQLFLGHSKPETTQIYAKTSLKSIQSGYEKALLEHKNE